MSDNKNLENNDTQELDENLEGSSEEILEDDVENNDDEIQKIKSENEYLKAELEKYEDKYLRLAAEYKNYQDRSKKEKLMLRQDSLIDAVSSVLPVIDDIERTLPSFSSAGEKYEKGVSMILKRISEVLKGLGVVSFGEKGEEFDPSVHNASSRIESNDDTSVVSEVYQKGYKLKDRLIRPAMVQVKG